MRTDLKHFIELRQRTWNLYRPDEEYSSGIFLADATLFGRQAGKSTAGRG